MRLVFSRDHASDIFESWPGQTFEMAFSMDDGEVLPIEGAGYSSQYISQAYFGLG